MGIVILLFLLSVTLVRLFQHFAVKKGWMDIPNARSSHLVATPRGGGVVFIGLWVLVVTIAWQQGFVLASTWRLLAFLPLCLNVVGFLDDWRSVPAKWRFLLQCAVAGAAVMEFGLMGVVGISLGFCLVWSINLFNFMDGLDGFAGCETIAVLGFGSYFLWTSGQPELAQLAVLLAVCVTGFLVWNWPRASIFMGDAGSTALGFIVVTFAALGQATCSRSLVLWLVLTALFWFDATVTLLRRFFGGQRWSQAHKQHAYQRLQQAGWPVPAIVIGSMGLNGILGLIALAMYHHRLSVSLGLAITVGGLTLVMVWIERLRPLRVAIAEQQP